MKNTYTIMIDDDQRTSLIELLKTNPALCDVHHPLELFIDMLQNLPTNNDDVFAMCY